MKTTLLANKRTRNSTINTMQCGINMNTELVASTANLAMNGYDFSHALHSQFDDIEDWYSREFLIMCSALRHTYTTSQFDGLLQDLAEYNRAHGRPEVVEALARIFSRGESCEPCRVLPLIRKGVSESYGGRGRRDPVLLAAD